MNSAAHEAAIAQVMYVFTTAIAVITLVFELLRNLATSAIGLNRLFQSLLGRVVTMITHTAVREE